MDVVISGKRNKVQLIKDIIDSVSIIAQNILLFDQGKFFTYKVVAGQLRILLCDTSKRGKNNNSLILKIFPDFKLHPLSFTIEDVKKQTDGKSKILFFSPGTISTGSRRITDIFDLDKPKIILEYWLQQNILDEEITLLSLISSVANKDGGAHLDINLDKVLRKTMPARTNGIPDHQIYIIEIGRYIAKEIFERIIILLAKDKDLLQKSI